MTKNIKFILLIIGVSLFAIIFSIIPLLQSERGLQRIILQNTPLGTSLDEVKKFASKKGWAITQERNNVDGKTDERNYPYVKGSSFLQLTIGCYLGGYANIEAFFGFDDNKKLIDVKIRKTYE